MLFGIKLKVDVLREKVNGHSRRSGLLDIEGEFYNLSLFLKVNFIGKVPH